MKATAFVVVLSMVLLSTASLAGDSANQAARTEVSHLTKANGPLSRGPKAEVPGLMNYQGTLTDAGGVALDTTVSMTFTIYDDSTEGSTKWTETQPAVVVSSGLFNVLLGSVNTIPDTVFKDPERWLGAQVGGDPELTPRQRIAAVGYAFWAAEADTAKYATSGAVDNDWVRGTPDSVLFTANYLGIARGGASNVLYGDSVHTHTNLGIACTTGTSGQDRYYTTISGGYGNTASGSHATVAGGGYNTASGNRATVGGGHRDTVNALYGGVAAGYSNLAGDAATDTAAFVGGGYDNSATDKYATVAGGKGNTADTSWATVSGGWGNTGGGWGATVGGGQSNTAGHFWATVGGGVQNTASGAKATVGGGYQNTVSSDNATVSGGVFNTVSGGDATVSGGSNNTASGYCATVGGGDSNTSAAWYSFTTGYSSMVGPSFTNSAAFNGQAATASGQTRVGALSKASGTFTIDHPTEPMNRILNHYFVESPEMVLIYRGVAIIGSEGRAEVHLPDYFDALNRNPMVQLTGVGTSDVYVSEIVTDNRFVIGGKPGTEVYWTVTGERKDPSAEITRILMPVEQLKEGDLAEHSLDDDFLASTMSQLDRMGEAGKFSFRTQAGREKYEKSRQALENPGLLEPGMRD